MKSWSLFQFEEKTTKTVKALEKHFQVRKVCDLYLSSPCHSPAVKIFSDNQLFWLRFFSCIVLSWVRNSCLKSLLGNKLPIFCFPHIFFYNRSKIDRYEWKCKFVYLFSLKIKDKFIIMIFCNIAWICSYHNMICGTKNVSCCEQKRGGLS